MPRAAWPKLESSDESGTQRSSLTCQSIRAKASAVSAPVRTTQE